MPEIIQTKHGRYDPIFEECVESRQKAARPITVKAMARELRAAGDLGRSEAHFFAEDYCTRKDLIRARGAEPDTPFPRPVYLAWIAAMALLLVYAAIR